MAQFGIYSLIYVGVSPSAGGVATTLCEEANCTLKRAGGAKVIETVAKGFAGLSPGAPVCQGMISNVIPATGLEWDAGPLIVALTVVYLKFVRADGKGCAFSAFIMDDDVSAGVGAASKYDFNFMGAFPQWM
jgi:hypothetical protein